MYFFVGKKQEKALNAIENAMIASGIGTNDVAIAMERLKRRPLLRMRVLSLVADEVVGAEVASKPQDIDWEAIGDFLVKIAPIIFQLIELFM